MSKFHTLQILRGIAASIVVVDHAYLRQLEWSTVPGTYSTLAQFSGTLAVAVFFVISGYIMIAKSGQQFGQTGAASDFLMKRIIRIVPLYWTATLLELALRYHKGAHVDPWAVFASLLFLPMGVPAGGYMRPLLGVGWTLNYEMFFYVIFAAALLFGKRIGLPFLLSTLVALVAFGAAYKPLTDTGPPHTLFAYWTDPILLLFAAGVVIGLFPAFFSGWEQRIRHPVLITLALLVFCLSVFLAGKFAFPLHLGWQLAGWTICVLAVGFCIFGRQSLDSGFAGAASLLGDMSYSLYLFHFFSIVAVEKVWWLLFGKEYSPFFVPVAYIGSVAAAYAIYHLIELNFVRLAKRDRDRRRAQGKIFSTPTRAVIGRNPPH
jgi:peptidoglycan/LPS O-acetylase OafA/YrhL